MMAEMGSKWTVLPPSTGGSLKLIVVAVSGLLQLHLIEEANSGSTTKIS